MLSVFAHPTLALLLPSQKTTTRRELTEYRSQLYQQPDAGYLAALSEVLMPDYRFRDALGLRDGCVEGVL